MGESRWEEQDGSRRGRGVTFKSFLAEIAVVSLEIVMSWGQEPCEAELPWPGPGVFHGFSPVSRGDRNNNPGLRGAVRSCSASGLPLVRALQVQLPGFPFPQCPLLPALKNPLGNPCKKLGKEKSQRSPRHRNGEMLLGSPSNN